MKSNFLNIFLSILLFILCLISISEQRDSSYEEESLSLNQAHPKVANRPLPQITENTLREIKDLREIIFALERYKIDHHSYPLSSNKGRVWDRFIESNGKVNQNWIAGLVPKYMERLPRDPRELPDPSKQYIYISDGANYKLLVAFADNCEEVRLVHPQLINPGPACLAYGFWTERAHW